MSATPAETATPLYEAALRFTEVVEYGIGFQDLISGKASLPPAGARFDVAYAGSLEGGRLRGTITGMDYLSIRADGRLQVHVHGRLVTPEGARIAFAADAVGATTAGPGLTQIRETVTLYSAFADYAWVNGLAVWSEGVIHAATGEIRVRAFAL